MTAFVPHPYQKAVIRKLVNAKRFGLFLDMGTGKTACALFAAKWLMMDAFAVGRALIVAPKKVAEMTWRQEAGKWDNLRGLSMALCAGTEKKRLEALDSGADVTVIGRDNLAWLWSLYEDGKRRWPYDLLILDESSSFKNKKSQRWRAAMKMARASERCWILTGTPSPNGLMDLWAQIYLLDFGQSLGKSLAEYRARYFHPGAHKGFQVYEWLPNKGAEERIYKAIGNMCLSLKIEDAGIEMPPLIEEDVPVALPPKAEEAIRRMEADYLIEVNEEDITAASAGVLANKLLQLASGAIYKGPSGEWAEIHQAKLDALEAIVEGHEDQPVAVFHAYRFDVQRVMERLKDYKPRQLLTEKDKEDWNAGRIRVLLVNPFSDAYGLNLQEGGHIAVWLGPIWNLELYQQANRRLYRQGQRQATIVYRLLAKGTIDETCAQALKDKTAVQDGLLEYVRLRK